MEVTKDYARLVYDALMLCWEIWDEMAQHPEWKGSNGKGKTGAFLRTDITCAACDFAYKRVEYGRVEYGKDLLDCGHCIMIELWPEGCTNLPSPYYSYLEDKGTTSDARIIADFAKEKAGRIAKKWGL
uniref:Uncharacterized protein n=1 Tax=viral metagenome TaxID=1070528 RepID=A0A6H1ZNB7_9ZZZZ